MRPHRAHLTKNLVDGYGLHNKMQVRRMAPQAKEDILLFHADGARCGACGGASGVW